MKAVTIDRNSAPAVANWYSMKSRFKSRRGGALFAAAALTGIGAAGSSFTAAEYDATEAWWKPGDARLMPASADYADALGRVRVLNAAGAIQTKDHAFFTALGSNG